MTNGMYITTNEDIATKKCLKVFSGCSFDDISFIFPGFPLFYLLRGYSEAFRVNRGLFIAVVTLELDFFLFLSIIGFAIWFAVGINK
jgi:hypothetical protein